MKMKSTDRTITQHVGKGGSSFLDRLILKKPVNSVATVLEKGKLSAVGRKIFNVLLFKAQQHLTSAGRDAIANTEFFEVKLAEVVDLASPQDSKSNLRALAKHYLNEMMTTKVTYESPDANANGVVWDSMVVLAQAKFVVRDDQTWLLFAFPPGLNEVLTAKGLFSQLNLSYMSSLSTYAGIVLYEICSRYKNNPSGVTSKHSTEWWTEITSSTPLARDPASKKKIFREWRSVKYELFNKAITEINEKTDLHIEMLEARDRRKVAEVQFAVQIQRKDETSRSGVKPVSLDLVELGLAIGITNSMLAKHQKTFTSQQIKIALLKTRDRVERADLAKIDDINRYFASVLKDLPAHDTAHQQSAEVGSVPASVAPVFGAQTGAEDALIKPAVETLLTWKDQRRADIKNELLALKKEDQKQYALAALDSLQKSGLATPTIVRKVQAADWSTGPLLSKIVDVYALTKYGPNWDVEPPLTASERAASLDFTDRELV